MMEMMKMPKKKLKHSEKQDIGEKFSKDFGMMLRLVRERLDAIGNEQVFKNIEQPMMWYTFQISHLNALYNKVDKQLGTEYKTIKKGIKKLKEELNWNDEAYKNMNNFVYASLINLGNGFKNDYQRNVVDINNRINSVETIDEDLRIDLPTPNNPFIIRENDDVEYEWRSQASQRLYNEIEQMVVSHPNGHYGKVQYHGKSWDWEAYMEQKVRTQTQREITNEMIQGAKDISQIFMIMNHFGNCRPQHAEFQGKIYVLRDWRNYVTDRVDEIEAYISKNKIMYVEDVIGELGEYCTTSPNCRHSFDIISVDDALGVKNQGDRNDLLRERGMYQEGRYKEENYEFMNTQRYNERMIRKWKTRYENAQFMKDKLPIGADATKVDEELAKCKRALYGYTDSNKTKHDGWLKKQKKFVDSHPTLERDYAREQVGDFYDLGAK